MKNKLSIHRVFFLNIIAVAFIVIIVFSIWTISKSYVDFQNNINIMHQEYDTEQKELIKSEVQKMVFYIRNLIHHYENRADHDIEIAKREILETLVEQRFGEQGCFFGSTFTGDPLFSNGVITLRTGSVWDLTDPNGVKIIQEQINQAVNPDGGFVLYSWNKLGEKQLSPKISYVAGLPEWQWIIGAGVYTDEIEKLITTTRHELQSKVKKSILILGIVIMIFLILFYIIAKLISKKIKRNLDLFSHFLRNIDSSAVRIDENKTDFPEFKALAHAVNFMVERREKAEEELKCKNEVLEKEIKNRLEAEHSFDESEKQLKYIIENSTNMFYSHTVDYILTYVSQQSKIILGYEPEEAMIQWTELASENPINDIGFNFTVKAIETGIPQPPYDLELIRKDGGKIWVEIREVPVVENGVTVAIVGALTDITERKEAVEELEKYRDKLELMIDERTQRLLEKTSNYEDSQLALSYLMEDVNEARVDLEKANSEMADLNKELESFSYSISHDLRAPLRAIDGFSKILEEEYGTILDEEGEEYLKIIRDNTQMMGELISDLLEFSRLSRKNLLKTSLDMNSIVLEECDKIKGIYPEQDVDFRISELLSSKGDRAMIKQTFANLVSNAVKYSSTRKKSIIEIGCKQDEDQIIYFVKDNGVGFDMKYSHKLFGVFQRLHAVEEFDGTGVGLAIVQRIVGKHGGKVWAESELDKGSTFYFTLE
jgi:PAS domain S-box-containing protein